MPHDLLLLQLTGRWERPFGHTRNTIGYNHAVASLEKQAIASSFPIVHVQVHREF